MENLSDKIGAYQNLSAQLTDKYRGLIHQAHPAVGMDMAFHLAHNWGNPDAKALLAKYDHRSGRLIARSRREINRADHRINHGRTFRPLWCKECKGRSK